MTRQVINTGTIANDGTGDTLRSMATKVNANFLELYTSLGDSSAAFVGLSFGNSNISFEGSSADAFETTLGVVDPTADRIVNIPNASGTIVLDSDTQTIGNKTLENCNFITAMNLFDVDQTHTYSIVGGDIGSNKIARFPTFAGYDSDTFVFRNQTQTVANKTLTTATITAPKINQINSTSNNEALISFTDGGSGSVTRVDVENSSLSPKIASAGTGTNIDLRLSSKGTGSVYVRNNNGSNPGTIITGTISGDGASYGLKYDVETISSGSTINQFKAISVITAGTSFNLAVAGAGTVKHVLNKTASTITITLGTGTFQDGTNTTTIAAQDGKTLVALGSSGNTWFEY